MQGLRATATAIRLPTARLPTAPPCCRSSLCLTSTFGAARTSSWCALQHRAGLPQLRRTAVLQLPRCPPRLLSPRSLAPACRAAARHARLERALCHLHQRRDSGPPRARGHQRQWTSANALACACMLPPGASHRCARPRCAPSPRLLRPPLCPCPSTGGRHRSRPGGAV